MAEPADLPNDIGSPAIENATENDTIMFDDDPGGTPVNEASDYSLQDMSPCRTLDSIEVNDDVRGDQVPSEDASQVDFSLGDVHLQNALPECTPFQEAPPHETPPHETPLEDDILNDIFSQEGPYDDDPLEDPLLYDTSQDNDGIDEHAPDVENERFEDAIHDNYGETFVQYSERDDEVLESVEEINDSSTQQTQHEAINFNMFGSSEEQGAPDHGPDDTEDSAAGTTSQSQTVVDSSSLFVSERGDRSPSETRPLGPSFAMPPPVQPLPVRAPFMMGLQHSAFARNSATPFRQSETPSRPTKSLFTAVRASGIHFRKKASASNNAASLPFPPNHTSTIGWSVCNQDDQADKAAIEKYQRKKQQYEDIKTNNGGNLPFKYELEWARISKAEEARCEKRQRDLLLDQQEAEDKAEMFPEIGYESRVSHEPEEDVNNVFDFNGVGSCKIQRTAQPNRPAEQFSMQDAEYQSMMVALDAGNDTTVRKKNRPSKRPGELSFSRSEQSSKPKSKRPKTKNGPQKMQVQGGRLTVKEKRAAQTARVQLGSLTVSNVFEQQANEDAAEQPSFISGVKANALKEIIASLPNDDVRAKCDARALMNATKDFNGRGSVKADKGLWRVKGMRTSLKPYQLLGSAWMRRKENEGHEPRGGLLADQMGLGKTLQMLANIINGRPPRSAPGPKATLLVASPALLDQWASEIDRHTDCNLSVMRFSSGSRIDSNRAAGILDGHDIVLTTWGEVMKSYPKNNPPASCKTAEAKLDWWKKEFQDNRGQLHRIKFLRVVLDEAQAIKNHKSRTSVACRGLIAKHKWAISGTPILNGLFELYPYFKFIGVPHTGDFEDFEQNYCTLGDSNAIDRLLIRLNQFMLRRTHADKMFGAPILKLPRADQSTYWCDFNTVERCVYDIVSERFRQKINTMMANREPDEPDNTFSKKKKQRKRNYSNIFVMLLRLRQLTGHILMLQFVMRDLLEAQDIRRIEEVAKNQASDQNSASGRTIIAIRRQLEDLSKQQATEIVDSEDDEEEEDDFSPTTDATGNDSNDQVSQDSPKESTEARSRSGRGFGKEYDFNPYLQSLKIGPEHVLRKKREKCSYCSLTVTTPWSMSCGHVICREPCLENSNVEAAEQAMQHSACKTCHVVPTFIHPQDEDQGDDFTDPVPYNTRSMKRNGRQKNRHDREELPKDWLDTIGDDVLPSTKTIAVKAQIMNWVKENKDVKIIIYTQFLAMVQIMARVCLKEGWQVEEYTGKMSFPARHKALKRFAENKESRVLLASLRCGGLGLNLTMAQRVIMVDPWWNMGSEQQAFCRVFRIGQTEKTYMSRICVRNTIDVRLIEMQTDKQKEIDGVMEDPGDKKWSMADYVRLFCNVGEDLTGRQFSLPDDLDE